MYFTYRDTPGGEGLSDFSGLLTEPLTVVSIHLHVGGALRKDACIVSESCTRRGRKDVGVTQAVLLIGVSQETLTLGVAVGETSTSNDVL